ncbi:MAG TPA: DNA primase [Armatimonadetes bacterium]|nr:DNA primase [Armatimonadota bacterium]
MAQEEWERLKEEIRDRTDIVEVIEQYVPLHKAGKDYRGLCPFHEDTAPSFTVSPAKQMWYCFGCQEGGDVFRFLQLMENLSFPEAAERLAQRLGMHFTPSRAAARKASLRERIYDLNRCAAGFYQRMLRGEAGCAGREYLAQRGLDEVTIARFRLGYAPNSWEALTGYLKQQGFSPAEIARAGLARPRRDGRGHYDYFRHRLIFPIHDPQGRVVAFGGRALTEEQTPKYLNTPETPAFDKSRTLYGLHLAARAIGEAEAAILVEGYLDAIAAHQFGLTNTVASLGTALTADHLRVLSRYTPRVFLVYDADSAGVKAALRSMALFEEVGLEVRIVTLPRGKDPDEFLRTEGVEAFRRLLDGALEVVDFRLRQVIARYGQHEESQRVTIVRELVPILAEVKSPLRQAEYLKNVATWWCYPHLERVGRVEEALREELRQFQRQGAKKRRKRSSPEAEEKTPTLPARSRTWLSERWLLSVLLQEENVLKQVRSELTPRDFQEPEHQQIVAAAYEQYDQTGRVDPRKLLAQLPEEVQRTLAEILLGNLQEEFTSVEILVGEIKLNSLRNRLQEIGRQLRNKEEAGDQAAIVHLLAESLALRRQVETYQEKVAGLLFSGKG